LSVTIEGRACTFHIRVRVRTRQPCSTPRARRVRESPPPRPQSHRRSCSCVIIEHTLAPVPSYGREGVTRLRGVSHVAVGEQCLNGEVPRVLYCGRWVYPCPFRAIAHRPTLRELVRGFRSGEDGRVWVRLVSAFARQETPRHGTGAARGLAVGRLRCCGVNHVGWGFRVLLPPYDDRRAV
jgi:hypothetical protein